MWLCWLLCWGGCRLASLKTPLRPSCAVLAPSPLSLLPAFALPCAGYSPRKRGTSITNPCAGFGALVGNNAEGALMRAAIFGAFPVCCGYWPRRCGGVGRGLRPSPLGKPSPRTKKPLLLSSTFARCCPCWGWSTCEASFLSASVWPVASPLLIALRLGRSASFPQIAPPKLQEILKLQNLDYRSL